MRRQYRKFLLSLAAVLALCGCASSGPAEGSSYGSIDDLVSAYVAAGGDCSNWEQTNVVTLAAESGACNSSTSLSTFSNQSDRDASVDNIKSLSGLIGGVVLLVGPNWITNSPDADQFRDELGGTLIDSTKG